MGKSRPKGKHKIAKPPKFTVLHSEKSPSLRAQQLGDSEDEDEGDDVDVDVAEGSDDEEEDSKEEEDDSSDSSSSDDSDSDSSSDASDASYSDPILPNHNSPSQQQPPNNHRRSLIAREAAPYLGAREPEKFDASLEWIPQTLQDRVDGYWFDHEEQKWEIPKYDGGVEYRPRKMQYNPWDRRTGYYEPMKPVFIEGMKRDGGVERQGRKRRG